MIKLNTVIKYSKYFIPALTLLSLSNLVLFYRLFDIRIEEYISIEEYITPFIGDLQFYLIALVIPILLSWMFIKDTVGVHNVRIITAKRRLSFKRRMIWTIKRDWIFILIIFSVSVFFLFFSNIEDAKILSIISFSLLLFILLFDEIKIRMNFALSQENMHLHNMMLIFVALLYISMLRTVWKVISIKHDKVNGTIVELQDRKIICNDSLTYVGRLKNFTFLYNRRLRESIVIDNQQVKNIIIKRD